MIVSLTVPTSNVPVDEHVGFIACCSDGKHAVWNVLGHLKNSSLEKAYLRIWVWVSESGVDLSRQSFALFCCYWRVGTIL